MPYIYVSESDLLEELEDSDLKKEYDKRELYRVVSAPEASDTLLQSADLLRSQGRNDLAFRLDEIRSEFA